VKEAALEAGLPVVQPERLGASAREEIAQFEPDLLACFAYGKIFGPKFLELFKEGALNVHPSLLPKYRGPAPIPAAIRSGDASTGVTVQRMAAEMDAGDIVLQEEIPLGGTETTGSLTELVAGIGATLLVKAIDQIQNGSAVFVPQRGEEATYTQLTDKADGRINWNDSAADIARQVRACYPWPKAFTTFGSQRLTIISAQPVEIATPPVAAGRPGTVVGVDTETGILVETGNGLLALQELQLPSRKPLDWRSFLNGVPKVEGAILGGF
jgi:methionyl-tRNA formyltransferase